MPPTRETVQFAGTIAASKIEALEGAFAPLTARLLTVGANGDEACVWAVAYRGEAKAAQEALAAADFTPAQFDSDHGTAKQQREALEKELEQIAAERAAITEELRALAAQLPRLRILYELTAQERDRQNAAGRFAQTETAFLMEGWAPAKAALAGEGIDLEIVQFSDYVTPNNALANGDIDLNAFQHRIYLQNEIDNYGYAIQNIGNTFIIPLNLYSQKVSSVDELKDGDVVAIPDDLTNGGRALKVLEAAGLIELDPSAAFNPTLDDITSYKVNITIEELKANTIPSVLPDVAAAVVNGNYALDFGLKTDEAIYKDSVLDVEEYWNLIAARTADLEDPDTAAVYKKVVEAFQSSATEDVFNNTFGGYFIAVGWDQDLIGQ